MPSIATKGPSLHHQKSVKASSVGDTSALVGGGHPNAATPEGLRSLNPEVQNGDMARTAPRNAAPARLRLRDGFPHAMSKNPHVAGNGHNSNLMTANDVELREHLRVCHPDFPGPGTVLRLVPGEPGAAVRWDIEIPEPARTIIAKPHHLTAIGLGRDVNAHLKTMFEALGLHAKRLDPAESIPAPPTSDPTRRSVRAVVRSAPARHKTQKR